MAIRTVRCVQVSGPVNIEPAEERQIAQLDIYPEYARKARVARNPGGQLTETFVTIEDDSGATGIFGPIFTEQAYIIMARLAPHLTGQDPLAHERLWDIMYRQDRHARAGYQMMAISAVDCALWDLKGKLLGQPVYRLLGGPSRERVPAYASMLGFSHDPDKVRERAQAAVAAGFQAQKWFFRYGPGDGLAGMAKNVALARTVREAVGPNIEIMFDCWMGWDATYAIRMLDQIAEFQPRWLEEPVPPDRINDFATIRRATHVPIATGEHEYTRWGFLQLLQADAIDVIQADPDWCGGISELVKICTLASAFGRQVIPHGHSVYAAVNVIAALTPGVCPMAEYLLRSMPVAQHFLVHRAAPENGSFALPTLPGLGIVLDDSKIEQQVELG